MLHVPAKERRGRPQRSRPEATQARGPASRALYAMCPSLRANATAGQRALQAREARAVPLHRGDGDLLRSLDNNDLRFQFGRAAARSRHEIAFNASTVGTLSTMRCRSEPCLVKHRYTHNREWLSLKTACRYEPRSYVWISLRVLHRSILSFASAWLIHCIQPGLPTN